MHLPNRFGGAKQPKVHLVDMLNEQEETGKFGQVISGFLQNKIESRLNKNEQVILLQNRRGFIFFRAPKKTQCSHHSNWCLQI